MSLDHIRHLVVVGNGPSLVCCRAATSAIALSMPGVDAKKLKVKDAMSEQPFVCPWCDAAEVCHDGGASLGLRDHGRRDGVISTTTDAYGDALATGTGDRR
jgi:hypothetical protein